MDEWNTKSLTTFERWPEIYKFVLCECISLKNIQLILEFSFAIPGTSAAIGRVFSITNALWTDERSSFFVETITAVIVTKTHFEELLCNDFYSLISNNPKLLKKFAHLQSTRHLPKRKEKFLQH
jgi:hypothetical protein